MASTTGACTNAKHQAETIGFCQVKLLDTVVLVFISRAQRAAIWTRLDLKVSIKGTQAAAEILARSGQLQTAVLPGLHERVAEG